MSSEARETPPTHDPVGQEQIAGQVPVPVVFFVMLGVLFYLSTLFLDSHAGGFQPNVYSPYASLELLQSVQPSTGDDTARRGKRAYETYCVACHQKQGGGVPGQFPPLAGSDWVGNEGPKRMIRIIMNGLRGPIEVSGTAWNPAAEMPPWKDLITDDNELAALISYVRGNGDWGNDAPAVSAEVVGEVRAEVQSRGRPWTSGELLETPAR